MLSRWPAYPTGFIEPCLPMLARAVPEGERWAYEVKHDGFRFIARREGDRVRVFSRNAKDWTDKLPAIVEALLALPVKSATLDGEGVVCDDWGVTDFERLRFALAGRGGSRTVFLYAFDLIELNGTDLRPQPWIGRREALASVLTKASNGTVLSEYMVGAPGAEVYAAACRMGLEGIVSKRVDRPYRSGRCADWLKIKNPDAPAATRIMEW
jgi:bifunctional non-homologous end joining protein LigD